ncbi:hypothetical protein CLG96_02195 [Sphingomonas oleivorans]|uniref:Uncharacterized protein n=2 Tax=Sphingomonas oleivorans TaxID=1735121 RepID=A0A2T5G1E8_9SPHN|nr:hypothetical protein CLG96_02195 [Sphingomonas oleivorans]
MPLTDWELWACAQQVIKTHGDRAPAFVAERIEALAVAGDYLGVQTLPEIPVRPFLVCQTGYVHVQRSGARALKGNSARAPEPRRWAVGGAPFGR